MDKAVVANCQLYTPGTTKNNSSYRSEMEFVLQRHIEFAEVLITFARMLLFECNANWVYLGQTDVDHLGHP